MFDLTKLNRILEWLQTLIIIYANGEDSLSRETSVILKRYKSNEVSDGREVFYCKAIGVDSIDARYGINLSNVTSFVGSFLDSKPDLTQCSFIVTKNHNYIGFNEEECAVFGENTDHIMIFIPRDVLEVKDLEYTLSYISDIIATFMIINEKDYDFHENYEMQIISSFLQYVFYKHTFNGDEYKKYLKVSMGDSDDFGISKSVNDFVDKYYNSNNWSLSSALKDGTNKFYNGDNEWWTNITSGIDWDLYHKTIKEALDFVHNKETE